MNAQTKVFDTLNPDKLVTLEAAGYLINEQGKQCRITEDMIKLACLELTARCHLPAKAKA